MAQPWFDVAERAGASATEPYDIVIVGVGAPEDADLYRASRAATAVAAPMLRDGGAIIVPARLDQSGESELDQRFLGMLASPDERAMSTGDDPALRQALALAETRKRSFVVIAGSEAPEVVRLAGLRAAVDVEEALDLAYEHIGRPQRAAVLLLRAPPSRAET
jgi:hypothetical protein